MAICFITFTDYAESVMRQYEGAPHEPLKLLDETLGTDPISKRYTKIPVPKQLRVKRSTITDAGLGVFATELIPKGTKMGPYKGVIIQESEIGSNTDCRYVWEVREFTLNLQNVMGFYCCCEFLYSYYSKFSCQNF